MATLPVKWFDWRFHGVPPMNGTPGSFINILDAVLVNGFGDTKVVSVTIKDKKATFILQDGVKFFRKSVVKITGFSNQALDGEYRVEDSDIGKVVIKLELPDGQIESTNTNIIVKYAPLGWFKPFSNVSKGIYKPSAVDALNWMFYMDDTGSTHCEVRIMENATSIDLGDHIGGRPSKLIHGNTTQDTLKWGKAYNANTIRRTWSIIGDPYCFYYKCSGMFSSDEISNNTFDNFNIQYGTLNFVGEGVRLSTKPDPFAVYLTGSHDRVNSNYVGNLLDQANSSHSIYLMLKPVNGITSNATTEVTFRSRDPWSNFNFTNFYSADDLVHLFTDNYFYSSDRRITRIPGVYTASAFKLRDNFDFFIETKDSNLDRDLIFLRGGNSSYAASYPTRGIFFDITGPWR